ncbi:hypothetical protein JMJ77_0005375 [Colletotrichum scovillei]|uniref:Uncharacterized protein n=1 Tax=Colletotrichum scovillei TaxID=1209932 RepID=A0A9P7RK71_9PEZI|nr:hypothetical protein JMJ77_0005375 [Colletotrichum scovillei]KAG7076592.1 hypothetical protein JMJ76_0013854 [Colletotrichum scovillei]KAG7083742.1 hypothetical protein JMJ78_0009184 [Colletotrichum scovillei]
MCTLPRCPNDHSPASYSTDPSANEHLLCETIVEDICRCSWFPAPRSEFPAILSMISRSVMFQ